MIEATPPLKYKRWLFEETPGGLRGDTREVVSRLYIHRRCGEQTPRDVLWEQEHSSKLTIQFLQYKDSVYTLI